MLCTAEFTFLFLKFGGWLNQPDIIYNVKNHDKIFSFSKSHFEMSETRSGWPAPCLGQAAQFGSAEILSLAHSFFLRKIKKLLVCLNVLNRLIYFSLVNRVYIAILSLSYVLFSNV